MIAHRLQRRRVGLQIAVGRLGGALSAAIELALRSAPSLPSCHRPRVDMVGRMGPRSGLKGWPGCQRLPAARSHPRSGR